MRFFDPSAEFLDWLAAHAGGRIVFDVGCGDGHLVKSLRRRKVACVGIDPLWDPIERRDPELCSAVIPTMAEECRLLHKTENTLVLFCRPCHSMFVERTLDLLPETAEALYISLPYNLGVDFDLDRYKATVVKCPPCSTEVVWRVTPIIKRRNSGHQVGEAQRAHREVRVRAEQAQQVRGGRY